MDIKSWRVARRRSLGRCLDGRMEWSECWFVVDEAGGNSCLRFHVKEGEHPDAAEFRML
jgi:hypothetical protein